MTEKNFRKSRKKTKRKAGSEQQTNRIQNMLFNTQLYFFHQTDALSTLKWQAKQNYTKNNKKKEIQQKFKNYKKQLPLTEGPPGALMTECTHDTRLQHFYKFSKLE